MTLPDRIVKALEHWAVHNSDELPKAIRCNPCELEKVSTVIKALDLAVEVVSNGGVLAGELWLVATVKDGVKGAKQ